MGTRLAFLDESQRGEEVDLAPLFDALTDPEVTLPPPRGRGHRTALTMGLLALGVVLALLVGWATGG